MPEPIALEVKSVIQETNDTVSIQVDKPESAQVHQAGQYITVEATVDNNVIRRAYSLSSVPNDAHYQFTVKRVSGGKMSNYLNDQVSAGDTLNILPPEGKFVVLPEADQSKSHYFFAAGSGITPVLAMIKTLLEEEERSTLHLLYGSRSADGIIFKEELDSLAERYKGQLFVTYTLSQKTKSSGVFGLFKKKSVSDWSGEKGRIDAQKIENYLLLYPSRNSNSHYYACGPGNMIQVVERTLESKGIAKKTIHKEYFTPDDTSSDSKTVSGEGAVEVILDGETFVVNVSKEKTILESILDMDKNPPYSCTSGACASCMAKTLSGKVEMETCFSLDDEEIADGYILTCQSHPVSSGVKITYDDL